MLEDEMLCSVFKEDEKKIFKKGIGGFLSTIFGEAEHLSFFLNQNYVSFLLSLIYVFSIVVISLKWTYILLFLVPLTYLFIFIIIKLSTKKSSEYFNKGREKVIEINPKTLDYLTNRDCIEYYSWFYDHKDQIINLISKRNNFFLKTDIINTLSISSIDIIKTIGTIILFLLVIKDIESGVSKVSTLLLLLTYYSQSFLPISLYIQNEQQIQRFDMFYSRTPLGFKNNIKINKLFKTIDIDIKFENASIIIENENQEVLKNISLILKKDLYGIVGLSGSGKTSLINILLGRKHLNAGKVLIDNLNIIDIPRPILYGLFNILPQNNLFFNESGKFNIVFFKKIVSKNEYLEIKEENKNIILNEINIINNLDIKNEKSYNKIIKIIAQKKIWLISSLLGLVNIRNIDKSDIDSIISFIKSINLDDIEFLVDIYIDRKYIIEEKYKDIISRLDISYLIDREIGEQGSMISGGEKQMLSIASFMLRNSFKIIIIDEPFTSLDLINEEKYLKIIKQFIQPYFTIVISHKMNVIKELSNKILVIDNSRIEAIDTHPNLLQIEGLYKKMYEIFIDQKK